MEEIVILLNKKRIGFFFLVVVGFFIIHLWLFKFPESVPIFNSKFLKVFSVFAMIFLLFLGIFYSIKFFDKNPGLIINEEGIIDNSSVSCAGLIKWENITDVKIIENYGQEVLIIEVNNADEIISKKSGLKKIIMNSNKSYLGTPIQIPNNILEHEMQELYDIIKKQLVERKNI